VKEIESLADPGTGEVRVACGEALSAGVLPHIIERMLQRYPRIRLDVTDVPSAGDYSPLLERKVNVQLSLLVKPLGARPDYRGEWT
jgi:DNA-binding transcriptional LysR family regulator